MQYIRENNVKILVCGGRDYEGRNVVRRELSKLVTSSQDIIMQGGARGADAYAKEWAEWRKCGCWTFPADWETHGKSAGPIRNKWMLEMGQPDLVLAFPGGRGTDDMIRLASAAGVQVKMVREYT